MNTRPLEVRETVSPHPLDTDRDEMKLMTYVNTESENSSYVRRITDV